MRKISKQMPKITHHCHSITGEDGAHVQHGVVGHIGQDVNDGDNGHGDSNGQGQVPEIDHRIISQRLERACDTKIG